MKKLLFVKLLGLILLFTAGIAQASFLYQATLTNTQETPPTPNQGSGGFASFVLNDARTRMTYDVVLFGLDMRGVNQTTGITQSGGPGQPAIPGDVDLNDNFTRLHIHAAAPGIAGGIVFGMIDLPANTGTINDVNPNDLIINDAALHITGAWDFNEGAGGQTLTSQLANLTLGGLYINVHTSDFGGGEIRGQILAVPEPGSLALLGIGVIGMLGVAGLRRRRRP